MCRKIGWVFLVAVLLVIVGTASASVPRKLNYQGRITHISAGVPLPGPHNMVFKIYDAETGGLMLWSENQTVIADAEGVVSTILGSVNPLAIPFDRYYWLQVEVDGEMLTPRREMVSAAYALNSYDSERLGGLLPHMYSLDGHNHDDRYYTESELNTPGTINQGTNPVDWTKLKSVPAGFADGTDDIGQMPAGTADQTLRHDGTQWVASDLLKNTDTRVTVGDIDIGPFGRFCIGAENDWVGLQLECHDGIGSIFQSGPPVNITPSWFPAVSGFGHEQRWGGMFFATGSGDGVYGQSDGAGNAVHGWSTGTGYSGYFQGGQGVHVEGDAEVTGTLSKGAGSFKIDHPLDPENKYLYHSFVESPDMMNIYNGNVTLDAAGEAWIDLPEWFGALNRDFRYQLTAIGAAAPDLHVATEIENNRFSIAGGSPGMKVSWQVTGIRQDAFAEANRIPVEEEKAGTDRGKYLHPEAFGMSKTMGINYDDRQMYRVVEE